MLKVTRSTLIQRPLEDVQAQFGDIAYHEARAHHRGVRFRVLGDDDEGRCGYEQVTSVGPARLRQRFRLDRADPAHQVNDLLEGAFAPGRITFDVVGEAADMTRVTATLSSERGGLTSIAAPILRVVLGRALAQGLREDRDDLESGSYAQGWADTVEPRPEQHTMVDSSATSSTMPGATWLMFLLAGPCLLAVVLIGAQIGVQAWSLGLATVLAAILSTAIGVALGLSRWFGRRSVRIRT